MSTAPRTFHVAFTGDFQAADGTPKYPDIGLDVLAMHPHITQSRFHEHHPVLGADQLAEAQGVVVLTPRVTAASVAQSRDLLAIGRFGVGYDAVDVEACTEADVLVFIAAGAVDHSVAEATVGWMIALTHHVRAKDRLVRECRWDERSNSMGRELRDRTFGAIGLGGIARKTIAMLESFGMNPPLAFDPYVAPDAAGGARLTTLDGLLKTADFVSIHCPLTDQTRNLIGRRELALMKPDAYLINTARGGIVDEAALYESLRDGRIAGAAIDCFAEEPVVRPHPLAALENVLLAPHSIAWTHELFRDIGRAVCQGMVELSRGKRPRGVVNPQVFERRGFQEKWSRLRVVDSGAEKANPT